MSDSKMVSELKPCPFCASTEIMDMQYDGDFWAQCAGCNTSSQALESEVESHAAWNTRAIPAEDVRAVDEPVGYAQTRDLEKISGRNVIHVGVLMAPKTQDGFEPLYRHAKREPQCSEVTPLCSEHLRTQDQTEIHPPQSTWPTWANWIALSPNGEWWYFANKPKLEQGGWMPGGRWENSLQGEGSNAWQEMVYGREV